MRKIVGTPIAVGFAAVALIAGGLDALAQERGGRGTGRGPGMFGPGFGLERAFDQIDKDGDGKIGKQEYADWLWERASGADADKDGALSRQEVANMPRPERPGPAGRGMRRGGSDAASFETLPQAKNDAETKILAVLADMRENQSRGMMNVSREDGRLLRLLTETVGAKHVVEIGTSNGYSGIWFCLALRTTGGKLTTHEIDARRAQLARENFKRAGVADIVTLVEGNAHEEVTKLKDPIDVLFLDADKEGYIDYLNKLLPLVRPGGLVLAHNVNPRQADPQYVKAITTNPDLETLFLLAQGAGVSATLKKR